MKIICHLTLFLSALVFILANSLDGLDRKHNGRPQSNGKSPRSLNRDGQAPANQPLMESSSKDRNFAPMPQLGVTQLPQTSRISVRADVNKISPDTLLDYTGRGLSFEKSSGSGQNSMEDDDIMSDIESHEDNFFCPPCMCSKTRKGRIKANCQKRKLKSIPSLPLKPWSLNMAQNKLLSFNTSSVLDWPTLFKLTLSSNPGLHRVMNGSMSGQVSYLTVLDLSSCNIYSIDDNSFAVMSSLLNLTLRKNSLRNLTSSTFAGLRNLQMLDLAINLIRFIEVGAFDHLVSLRTLDLSRNIHLSYSERKLSPLLFTSLKQLRDLYIQGSSNRDAKYPDKVLGKLANLQRLRVDGLGGGPEFGAEVKLLKYLQHLEMGTEKGKCYLKTITATFFQNTPHLVSFSIEHCRLMYINSTAFAHIRNLASLSISFMRSYDLDTALKELEGLRNSSLKKLSLIHLYHAGASCRSLGRKQAEVLKYLELEELDLSYNLLVLLGDDFLHDLKPSLKRLILRRNKFTLKGNLLVRMYFLHGLTELDMSQQNKDILNSFPVPKEAGCSSHVASNGDLLGSSLAGVYEEATTFIGTTQLSREWAQDESDGSGDITCSSEPAYVTRKGRIDKDHTSLQESDSNSRVAPRSVPIPPKLKILKASEFSSLGMLILTQDLPENNSLTDIDFSGSYLRYWGYGNMPRGIQRANLNDNLCTGINKNFFVRNNSLVHLTVNNNFLGPDFSTDINGSVFAELDQLQYLDVSTNLIFRLPRKFFKGLVNLRTLILSNNQLQVLNTTMSHMKKLQYLGLSRNSITWITRHIRDDLSEIASHHRLEIDLSYNPLPCTCAGIEVLHWMATTKAVILNEDLLMCRKDDGDAEDLRNVTAKLKYLQRYCVARAMVVVICVASITVLTVIVGFAMMYRCRWKLRYLWSIAVAKLFGFKPLAVDEAGRKFDAYFLYTEDCTRFVLNTCIQELEIKRGHRLCVEDRDFLPGTLTISNIVSAVQSSTKVVPVVTPDFYEGRYTEYGIKMAVEEELSEKRSILHLFIYKPVPSEDMEKDLDLLRVMKRNDYTEFPPAEQANEEVIQNFWDQLSQAIGHTCNNEQTPLLTL